MYVPKLFLAVISGISLVAAQGDQDTRGYEVAGVLQQVARGFRTSNERIDFTVDPESKSMLIVVTLIDAKNTAPRAVDVINKVVKGEVLPEKSQDIVCTELQDFIEESTATLDKTAAHAPSAKEVQLAGIIAGYLSPYFPAVETVLSATLAAAPNCTERVERYTTAQKASFEKAVEAYKQ